MSVKKAKEIILDENLEVLDILSKPPENYITFNTMKLIGTHYYMLGLDTKQVRKKLLEYCMKSDYFNLTLRSDTMEKALTKAKFHILKSSNYKIGITRKEIDKLRMLSHSDYKVALYILFIAKLERYQKTNKKDKKAKSFITYFNYRLKTAYYNVTGNNNTLSKKDDVSMLNRLIVAGIAMPTLNQSLIVLCADFENSKNIEFIIDASRDFLSQIKYYCVACGKETKKNKRDHCDECYKIIRNESEKERLKKHYLNSRS